MPHDSKSDLPLLQTKKFGETLENDTRLMIDALETSIINPLDLFTQTKNLKLSCVSIISTVQVQHKVKQKVYTQMNKSKSIVSRWAPIEENRAICD